MYRVSKRMEIAGAHKLNLPYDSPCQGMHGHNWIVTVHCCSEKLTKYGMIVDFAKVKKAIHGKFDHQYINSVLPIDMNPTAENMAKWICDEVSALCEVGFCYKVSVQESEGNIAEYIATEVPTEYLYKCIGLEKGSWL